MKRFMGLSLMCLMFLSVQAGSNQGVSEFKGSSWSLYMSQNNDEPIKVQSERREYDENGVTHHKKSKGIIKDGIYKPIEEKDFKSPFKKRSFFGCEPKKDEKKFDREEFLQDQHKAKPHKKRGGLWKVLAYPFVKEDDESSQEKTFQKKRFHGLHPKFTGPEENNMEEKLSRRSRISFYRPVEKMFEKIFGQKRASEERRGPHVKKSPFVRESDYQFSKIDHPSFYQDQDSRMQRPMRPRSEKNAERSHPGHWFDDFERRQQAMWKQMRELENAFFSDFYEDVD